MRRKFDLLDIFCHFQKQVECYFNRKILSLHFDWRGDYELSIVIYSLVELFIESHALILTSKMAR